MSNLESASAHHPNQSTMDPEKLAQLDRHLQQPGIGSLIMGLTLVEGIDRNEALKQLESLRPQDLKDMLRSPTPGYSW